MKPDLNLLVVFDAIARFGSVSAAAQHLALSQPAVSHALNRLRKTVGDPLFTRAGRGLIATPRAADMMAEVRALVQSAQNLASPAQFVPATSQRSFRIAASDYAAYTVVPSLMRLLRADAPGLRLDILPANGGVPNELALGQLDLSFWGTIPPGPPFHNAVLFHEHYQGVACIRHPMFQPNAGVGLADYLRYPHAVVSLQAPGANAVDQALQTVGLARHIGLSSHSFAGNLAALHGSDLIASLPARMCQNLPSGLRSFDLPLMVPPYDYGLVWHDRTHVSAPHRWLRGCVARALEAALV